MLPAANIHKILYFVQVSMSLKSGSRLPFAPLLLLLFVAVSATPQSSDKSAAPANASDQTPTFKSRVNLVVVPVVVRDQSGQPVGNLTQQDFHLFDNNKPQEIASFNLQTNEIQPAREPSNALISARLKNNVVGPAPSHFFAYLFDDLHIDMGDLQQIRAAAKKHLESHMGAGDRAAVYTTSGHISLEFTADRALIATAMDRITPHSLGGGAPTQCPYMNYHLALTIVGESSANSDVSCGTTCPGTPAWNGATEDVWNCLFNKGQHLDTEARNMALQAARSEAQVGEANTHAALITIQNVVRHLAAMPGSRTLLLVSSGFQTSDERYDQNDIISLATHSNIIISAIDARGLYTDSPGSAGGDQPSDVLAAQLEAAIIRQGRLLQTEVMAELAEGTGGKFLHDNNDFLGGFNQLASPPRFIYMIAFKPQDLKQNGRYHKLKVVVDIPKGYTVQARRGYYEATRSGNPDKDASEELQQALFSRDEMHSMPIVLKAQYLKPDEGHRNLIVTTHIDPVGIHFRHVESSNLDDLTVVCGLFDLNGNYVDAKKQEIKLRLNDDTLHKLTDGINVKTNFDVKPGAYVIRVVIRDSEDQLISAVNGSAAIP